MNKDLKVAIFKLDSDDFEKYYNQQLSHHNCTVFPFSSLLKKNVDNCRINFSFKKIISLNLKEFDIVIVFEILKIIPIIRLKMNPKAKLILWNWNKKTKEIAKKEKLVSLFCETWTFDSNDAKEFGWRLNNQFYLPINVPMRQANLKKKAFCACLDKGRYLAIKNIRKLLIENNVDCDFTLVKDDSSIYDAQDLNWVKDEGISYKEILQHVFESDILIDFVKPGQSGLTVRTMEALFYKKKIITNNLNLAKCPFYNKNNILIGNNLNEDVLKEFLYSDYVEINKEYLVPYTYNTWISNFLK